MYSDNTLMDNPALLGRRRSGLLLAVAVALSASAPAFAEKVSLQFSQVFPDGGQIDGFAVGEDLNGDGRLYSMASFIGGALGLESGDEVDFMSVTFRDFSGRTFTNVYDKSEAGIEDDANVFMGFAYNLDGGPIGDDPDEGVSMGPLAPSTSYFMGPLLTPASPVGRDNYGPCGNADGLPCADVVTLTPVDPFPNFELDFESGSSAVVAVTDQLRFEFRQVFENGGEVRGVVSGMDLDGDGRLTTYTPFAASVYQLPVRDEVEFIEYTLSDFNGVSLEQGVDRSETAFEDFAMAFTLIDYDLTGPNVGDEADEILFQGPLAPSFLLQVGTAIPLEDSNPGVTGDVCGNENGAPCAYVAFLEPAEAPGEVTVTFSDVSNQTVEMVPAPLVADGEFTGSWYDPANDGEGFTIEALTDGRAIVYWYTYTETGAQRWFGGEARREGLSLVIDELIVTEGGMFGPQFDPATVERTPAGSLRIDFAGCNSGVATFVVDGIEGTLDIIRLTRSDNIACGGTSGTERIGD